MVLGPTKSGKARCCWRQCYLVATEMGAAPEFPLCKFHHGAVTWMRILDELGVRVDPKTPPFRLPFVFLETLKALGHDVSDLRVTTDEQGCYGIRYEPSAH